MAKKMYIGVNNKGKLVNNLYIGVDGTAKQVTRAYIGDNSGKAKLVYPFSDNEVLPYEILLNGINVTYRPATELDTTKTWVELVTNKKNLKWSTREAYSITITAPAGYTARVYRKYLSTSDKYELTLESGFPLGTDPVYESVGGLSYPSSSGPEKFIATATFYDNVNSQDIVIVVELTKKEQAPVFDASEWVNYIGASGRGSTGIDRGWTGTSNAAGNIETTDNWRWESKPGAVTNQPLISNGNGTYDYVWTWQTNTSGAPRMILNKMSFNGERLLIPLIPETTSQDEDAEAAIGRPGTYGLTYLSDGTEVNIRMVRIFGNFGQRVYTITIKNAHGNIIVTDGNIDYLNDNTHQYIPNLYGVCGEDNSKLALQQYRDGVWEEYENLFNIDDYFELDGDPTNCGANIRFKLMDGYANPFYEYAGMDADNRVINSSNSVVGIDNDAIYSSEYIYGPDNNGWYYIHLDMQPQLCNIYTLTIKADKEG